MYSMIPFGRMNTSWNDLFDDFERRMFPADRGELPAFRTDIRDEGDHFLLEADLPGFRKEDIDLHLQDGVLTITAKRQEEQEEKKENLIHTFDTLLELGIIPVVNENDSVSYTEIESDEKLFGDNDMLSAIVAVLCRAGKLVILSDIDGLYDSDPRLHPNAKLLSRVECIDESKYALAGGAGSRRGTGGMRTKLKAAELAVSQGIDTIIANGRHPDAIYEIIRGGVSGTLFPGKL